MPNKYFLSYTGSEHESVDLKGFTLCLHHQLITSFSLGNSLDLHMPQLPHLSEGNNNNSTYLTWLCEN